MSMSRAWFEPPLFKDWIATKGVVDRGLNSLHRASIFLGSQTNIPSEDAQTAPLFGTDKSSHALFPDKPGLTLFSYEPMFPAATTASSGTPWRPALLFNNDSPFTFGVSEVVSVPGIGNANAVTSNEPDGESQSIRVTKTMVTDPSLDDDRWGLFVMYKRKFWFEENDYDVPESYFYQTGEKIQPNTIELVKRFLKQVRESRGYDVDCCPPRMFESPFTPLPLEEMRQGTRDSDKFGYATVVEAAECAIQKIREETGHSYKLVKVEKAVLTRALVLFLTLTAEEDAGPVQTIQAAVYHPLGGNPVLEEWRFKPLPAH
ncbi:Unknown protein [Striga hermonthica]|uniref:Uncharacterized protein n=1 Tax=Striga hermonthica TaxID=68872 RepID=A0A9N7MTW9_STRHE|nr:Unknown protein [Striga hermonthica]